MKLIRLVIPIAAGLLLAGGTLSALANGRAAPSGPVGLTVQETALLPNAESEDIHADASGQVWVSESLSGSVRRLDPATGMYTLYTGLGQPSDAQLGPDGSLWFADDNQPQLARMDLTSRVVTTWTAPTMSANNGMAFDSFGRVWFIDDLANIDRFDPSNHQMCTIPLPGTFEGAGTYLMVGGGAVWLGDRANSGLGRIAATLAVSPTYTFWPLDALGASDPLGLALAPNGDVWWGNGFGSIGRLEPST